MKIESGKIQSLPLSVIRLDGGTQCRADLYQEHIDSLVEAWDEGADIPAITVYYDGSNHWMSDGFHRYHAAQKLGYLDILANVISGTRLDAVKHAVGANATHGLPRTPEDRKRAVEVACKEFSEYSNVMIAEICNVSEFTVRKYKPNFDLIEVERTIGKDGKSRPATRPKPEPEPEHKQETEHFVCSVCGDVFNDEVWHCEVCNHHWPMSRTECWNCHEQNAPKKPDTFKLEPVQGPAWLREKSEASQEQINPCQQQGEPESKPKQSTKLEQEFADVSALQLKPGLSFYQKLQVVAKEALDQDPRIIKRIYQDLAKLYHPDKHINSTKEDQQFMAEIFSFISKLKDVLEGD